MIFHKIISSLILIALAVNASEQNESSHSNIFGEELSSKGTSYNGKYLYLKNLNW